MAVETRELLINNIKSLSDKYDMCYKFLVNGCHVWNKSNIETMVYIDLYKFENKDFKYLKNIILKELFEPKIIYDQKIKKL